MAKSNPFAQNQVVFRDEDHSYTEVATGNKLISATTLIGRYSKPFDENGFIIRKCAAL